MKDYSTIRYDLSVRRDAFYRGINPESVGSWLRSLRHEKEQLNEIWQGSKMESLGINEAHGKSLMAAIDEEISLAEFYFEYARASRRPDFDKWKFVKDFQPHDYDAKKDAWIKTNGKLKALVFIKPGVATTRVSLSIQNDSTALRFYTGNGYGHEWEIEASNLRSALSIEKKVEELKASAEKLFKECSRPLYCHEAARLKELDQFLHNGVEI